MLRWLGVLVIAIGCGRSARVHGPKEIWLKEIRVVGNKSVPEDDLVPGLALDRTLRDGQGVDPYLLSLDTKRIRGAYLRLGFFEAKVDAKILPGNAQVVVFTIEEGPRAIARVTVTGLPPELPEDVVLAKLELKDGAPFDYELYDDGKLIVQQLVEEAGYPHVDLDESVVTVDRKTRVAAASYRVVLSGPRAKFGEVRVLGVEEFPALEEAIRGRLSFAVGDIYTPRAIVDTTRNLYDLGRFSQVRFEPDRSAHNETVPVTISVTVAGRHVITGGGGLGYEPATYEARVRGGFTYIPKRFPLLGINGDARLAVTVDKAGEDLEPKIRALGSIQRLELFRPFVIGDVGGGYEFFTVEAYTARGPIAKLSLTAPLGRRWLVGQLAWSFSRFRFSDVSSFIEEPALGNLGLGEIERNGRVEQTIAADGRDKPLEPRRGWYVGLRVIEGGKFAGGKFTYLEVQPDLRYYIPIRSASTLAFRARGGSFFGEIPLTQRYFSGGAQGHRGFSARRLSPTSVGFEKNENGELVLDTNGNPIGGEVVIGGEVFVETGVELRVPLFEKWGLLFGSTLFLDGGDVVQKSTGLDLRNLHWAAGTGMFVKFGGFKVRIDVGQRLNRTGPEDPEYDEDGFFKNTTLSLGVGETY